MTAAVAVWRMVVYCTGIMMHWYVNGLLLDLHHICSPLDSGLKMCTFDYERNSTGSCTLVFSISRVQDVVLIHIYHVVVHITSS